MGKDAKENKVKITPELVEHTAHLGMLELTPQEKEKFARQMNDIMGHFEKLNEVNVDNVQPTTHVMDIKNVFRDDTAKESLEQKEALKNASETENGFIKGPKIV